MAVLSVWQFLSSTNPRCVCVCVCVRERERNDGAGERDTEGMIVQVLLLLNVKMPSQLMVVVRRV